MSLWGKYTEKLALLDLKLCPLTLISQSFMLAACMFKEIATCIACYGWVESELNQDSVKGENGD